MRIGALLFSVLLLPLFLFASSPKNDEFDAMLRDMIKMQEQMNRIFAEFNNKYFLNDDRFFNDLSFSPKSDIIDKKGYYEVKLNMPGYKDADVNVKVKDNLLYIDVKSQYKKEDSAEHYIKRERFIGSLHKTLLLPSDADGDKLTTSLKDGVLSIKIPKKG
jgi:HSP20 family protein